MRRTILATCAGVAASLTLWAQTPATPRPSQPSTSALAPTDLTTMTVTGCLKPWNESTMSPAIMPATPEGGTPSVAGGDVQYVLTDIDSTSPRPGTGATPSTARPGSTASDAPHVMYLVKPKDSSVNLSPHVNHKIQVTGTISSDSSLRTPSTTSSTMPNSKPTDPPSPKPTDPSTTSRETTSAAGKPATLIVSALRMVSTSCAPTSR